VTEKQLKDRKHVWETEGRLQNAVRTIYRQYISLSV